MYTENSMADKGLLWAIALGIANIALNTFASEAAANAVGLREALARPVFLAAFLMGMISLGCMMGLYTSGYPLGRGILIAGATSIVLGTVWATVLRGNQLTLIEWILWGTILLFYGVRASGIFRPA